jgi:hypothetical protein
LFLEIVYFFIFWGSSEAAMGGGARSAQFGVEMGPKGRVRAAHARQKPTSSVRKDVFKGIDDKHFVKLFWLFSKTNFLSRIPFRSELRNWLFRGTRNDSE